MKRLVLVRHGKSSWEGNLPDDRRPLTERGHTDGQLVASTFKGHFDQQFLIWSSYAERARTTARIFQEVLEVKEKLFKIVPELYTFDADQLLEVIKSCDDAVDYLMVFGHNPAITGVANTLGDHGFSNVPTTGLVYLEFSGSSWKNLGNGSTVFHLFPKNLK